MVRFVHLGKRENCEAQLVNLDRVEKVLLLPPDPGKPEQGLLLRLFLTDGKTIEIVTGADAVFEELLKLATAAPSHPGG